MYYRRWSVFLSTTFASAPFSLAKNIAVASFHDSLNPIDQHISFTIEHESKGQLSFLDTLISRDNSWKEEAWKKSVGNLLRWSFFNFMYTRGTKYELFHIYYTSFHSSREIWTQLIGLAPNVWLHSSVDRASHRYSRRSRVRIPLKLLLSSCLSWKFTAMIIL